MQQIIPRPEHPRPDFFRPDWLNLNGEWQFAFDEQDQGFALGYTNPGHTLPLRIQVPFAHECEASGLNDKRFSKVLWYRRSFAVPAAMQNRRVLLRFGAVDYRCEVFVNGVSAGSHVGGYTPFALDVTRLLREGENDLCVRVEDDRDCTQPRGKQYWKDGWMGCWYTPTSGIWQTVYLEATGDNYLKSAHIVPNIDQATATFLINLATIPQKPLNAEITISFNGQIVRRLTTLVNQRMTEVTVSMSDGDLLEGFHTWSPAAPNLYDVKIRLLDGSATLDEVDTYFGMRKVEVKDGWVLLNNRPLYQRLVLDQGYWPESMLTPPSDEAIRADLEWTKKLGYNGARKHQKLEDPRYYYWADKLGLLIWGELPSAYEFTSEMVHNLSDTLTGFIDRDFNHPSIIAWVPLNESWGVTRIYNNKRMQETANMLYRQAKALDDTRLVSVNDGWEQVTTDIFGLHDYAATGEAIERHFRDREETTLHSCDWRMACCDGFTPTGKEAFMVTEYGGIAFQDGAGGDTWGYHDKVSDEEAFFARFKSVNDAVRAISYCQGYCYTQLTDVQQETNGLLTPDRKPKVDVERFRALNINPDNRVGR
jgi:beta-galactosidase/beta-glucuronidase